MTVQRRAPCPQLKSEWVQAHSAAHSKALATYQVCSHPKRKPRCSGGGRTHRINEASSSWSMFPGTGNFVFFGQQLRHEDISTLHARCTGGGTIGCTAGRSAGRFSKTPEQFRMSPQTFSRYRRDVDASKPTFSFPSSDFYSGRCARLFDSV